ncbi:unnamed protein product [Phaeothamnion confervicola]
MKASQPTSPRRRLPQNSQDLYIRVPCVPEHLGSTGAIFDCGRPRRVRCAAGRPVSRSLLSRHAPTSLRSLTSLIVSSISSCCVSGPKGSAKGTAAKGKKQEEGAKIKKKKSRQSSATKAGESPNNLCRPTAENHHSNRGKMPANLHAVGAARRDCAAGWRRTDGRLAAVHASPAGVLLLVLVVPVEHDALGGVEAHALADALVVALEVAHHQRRRLAVERVCRVWIAQQLRQEEREYVHQVCRERGGGETAGAEGRQRSTVNSYARNRRKRPRAERRTEHGAPGLVDDVKAYRAAHLVHVGMEHAVLEADGRRLVRVLLGKRHVHLPGPTFVRRCKAGEPNRGAARAGCQG